MPLNTRKSLLWTALLLMILPGCEIGYNGGLSSRVTDPKLKAEYERFKLQHELAMQQAQAQQQIQRSHVDFDAPGYSPTPKGQPMSMTEANRTTGPAVPSRPVEQYASIDPRPTMGMMRLYGQMRNPVPANGSPLDGNDNLQQVTFAEEGADFDPDLSPDGKLLVFASTRHRDASDIYLQEVGGSSVRQLTSDPAPDMMPAFSPDGRFVAFTSKRSGNWDIFLIDVQQGGPVYKLTDSPSDDIHPSFSPDGKRIVYCTYGSKSGQWELAVLEVDNPQTPRLIGKGLFPNWSPVDNRIVFQRARERGTRWFSVWTLEYDNGEGKRLTELAASSNAAAITPDWSPDGRHIVFCTVVNPDSDIQNKPVQSDVWIMADDGSGRANLTRSRFANLQPVWARDGGVFFVSNRGTHGSENIWAAHTAQALRVAQPNIGPASGTATVEVDTNPGPAEAVSVP